MRANANRWLLTSLQLALVATSLRNVDPSEIGIKGSPNPAPMGQFTLQPETRTRAILIFINKFDRAKDIQAKCSRFSWSPDSGYPTPGKLAPAIYYLVVVQDKRKNSKKIIVGK